MRRITSAAITMLLAGTGSSLLSLATIVAAISVRHASRTASIQPYASALGLIALLTGVAALLVARRRLNELAAQRFRSWSLREL